MLTQSTPYLLKAIFGNFTHTLAGVGITPIKVGIAPTEVGITHTVAGIAEDVDFNKKTVSVQQSHLEIGSEVLQDCVHKFDCGHNAQYLREPKIFDPANPSQIFA